MAPARPGCFFLPFLLFFAAGSLVAAGRGLLGAAGVAGVAGGAGGAGVAGADDMLLCRDSGAAGLWGTVLCVAKVARNGLVLGDKDAAKVVILFLGPLVLHVAQNP